MSTKIKINNCFVIGNDMPTIKVGSLLSLLKLESIFEVLFSVKYLSLVLTTVFKIFECSILQFELDFKKLLLKQNVKMKTYSRRKNI